MMTIYDILKKAEAEFPKPDPSDDKITYFLRDGWHEAIAFIRAEIDTAIISDSDWISPIPEQRKIQEDKLKSLFPSYPKVGPKWQYMNGLLEMAMGKISHTNKKS